MGACRVGSDDTILYTMVPPLRAGGGAAAAGLGGGGAGAALGGAGLGVMEKLGPGRAATTGALALGASTLTLLHRSEKERRVSDKA